MVYLIGRHYVFNQETLNELQIIVDNTKVAEGLIAANKYPLELGLKITINEEKVGLEISTKANAILQELPKKTWLLYDPVNRGAGTSYRQILFNPSFSARGDGIVVNADFDQYIINKAQGLESILDLVKDVKNKNALYGIGSRDIPVVLAKHQRNSSLRIIHELFHSLAVGKEKLDVHPQIEGVTPAYASLGETSPGLYVMNQDHENYPELVQFVSTALQHANLQGFASDYYVAIKASQLAPIGLGYVKAQENKFYKQITEEDEHQQIIRLISSQTMELGRTDVKNVLQQTVANEANFQEIASFYDEKDVSEVRQSMLQALSR